MSFWSIVIAAVFFILPSLLSGKKSTGKKAVPAASVPEDDFPMEGPHFMGDDDEALYEEEETVEADDLGQPVFSYETIIENKDNSERIISEEEKLESRMEKVNSMSVNTLDEDFDLRKAIIYQTIMQRVSA